jgi:hypothetical protein
MPENIRKPVHMRGVYRENERIDPAAVEKRKTPIAFNVPVSPHRRGASAASKRFSARSVKAKADTAEGAAEEGPWELRVDNHKTHTTFAESLRSDSRHRSGRPVPLKRRTHARRVSAATTAASAVEA